MRKSLHCARAPRRVHELRDRRSTRRPIVANKIAAPLKYHPYPLSFAKTRPDAQVVDPSVR